ncbi:MAG: hypothetical protein Q8M01_15490 [Rubrivivax sp.]|nr:hypothetical protein [Rubrivivax sp.]
MTAPNATGASRANDSPRQDQTENKHADCAAPLADVQHDEAAARAAVEALDKRITGAMARAAMAGVTVHLVGKPGGGSEFLAFKWQHSRTFADVAALESWLAHVAGVQP